MRTLQEVPKAQHVLSPTRTHESRSGTSLSRLQNQVCLAPSYVRYCNNMQSLSYKNCSSNRRFSETNIYGLHARLDIATCALHECTANRYERIISFDANSSTVVCHFGKEIWVVETVQCTYRLGYSQPQGSKNNFKTEETINIDYG